MVRPSDFLMMLIFANMPVAIGCEAPAAVDVLATPDAVLAPRTTDEAALDAKVVLTKVTFAEMSAKIAAKKDEVKDAKYILVDAWATWCTPCKENFPHVVEMNKKYASKGLVVCSLSLDDPSEPKQVAEAEKFLKSKNAVFTNFLLNETPDDGFTKLKLTTIPAVILYTPDGKEFKRFTMEDIDNQFTYDQVEEEVKKLLNVK